MPLQPVIIHERLARWSRQLRPRFKGSPIRWRETRSTSSLLEAVASSIVPILVMDLDDRPARGLDDLRAAHELNPSTLSMVIEPAGRGVVIELAREVGATLVLGGVVVPPEVESLLHRWLPIAAQRAESGGWWPTIESEPEPWESPELFLGRDQRPGP